MQNKIRNFSIIAHPVTKRSQARVGTGQVSTTIL